ncbi:MAG: hypothetical protein ACE5JU_18895 [Candidatus Binatia bacterium]
MRFHKGFTKLVLAVFVVTSAGFTSVVEVCCPPESSMGTGSRMAAAYCSACFDQSAEDTEFLSANIRCHTKQVRGGRVDVQVVEPRRSSISSLRVAEDISVDHIWGENLIRILSRLSILLQNEPPVVHSKAFLLNSSLLI